MRGKNGGDANDVARRDSGVSQRELETREPLPMFSDSFGEEDFLRDERHVCRVAVPPLDSVGKN